MAVYSLDIYYFIDLHCVGDRAMPPPAMQETTMVISRPGVDGTGVMRLGEQCQPFQMRSAVDVQNKLGADNAQDAYGNMIGRGRYNMVWGDTDYSVQHKTKFIVLDVVITKMQRLSVSIGGINPPSGYWLEALWTLVAVPSN